MITRHAALTLLLAACFMAVAPAYAQGPAQPPADTETNAAEQNPKVITVDREKGVIDLAAKMVPAEPQWLELVATVPGGKGRGHEAIVTVDAKPSHIHLALVTLGLEPGHPLKNKREGDVIVSEPPAGPQVELFFVYEKDGLTHEDPVHKWVLDAATGEPLPPCRWLFTGSVFREWEGKAYYMADEAGNIASLVNFGDDMIVRQTDMAQDSDFQQLQLNKDKALPYGSDLVLRIRLARPAADAAEGDPQTPEPSDKSGTRIAPDEP